MVSFWGTRRGCGACCVRFSLPLRFFFFDDTATTEIYTLSLHDALPIWRSAVPAAVTCDRIGGGERRAQSDSPLAHQPEDFGGAGIAVLDRVDARQDRAAHGFRSEEHTSELQSLAQLVRRLPLEKEQSSK